MSEKDNQENPAGGKAGKPDDYQSYIHPSAHGYLPKEDGMVQNVRDEEKGTFDTSEDENEKRDEDENVDENVDEDE